MKKILSLYLALFIIVNISFSQPCLPNGIVLETQFDIDNFASNYPNCTEIQGDVWIFNMYDGINNLNGLNVITSIEGNLDIGGIPNCNWTLESLTGLENLNYIGGNLLITYNSELENLNGLNGLTEVAGSVEIKNNNVLIDISGLESIESIGGDLSISNNEFLSQCNNSGICNYLESPNGTVKIFGNEQGCSTPPEVADSCGISMPCLPFGNYYITKQSEINNFTSDYSNCHELNGYIYIKGNDITNLNGLNEIDAVNGDLYIKQCISLTSLDGLENVEYIDGFLEINSCSSLENIAALHNLTAIGNLLYIGNNDALISLEGLNNLESTGLNLSIFGNELLSDIEALSNLEYINGILGIGTNNSLSSLAGLENISPESISKISIKDNILLTECEIKSVCDYIADSIGYVVIENNGPNCNSVEEVSEACSLLGDKELEIIPKFQIVPNPAKDLVTFEIDKFPFDQVLKLQVFDMHGHEVFRANFNTQKLSWDATGLSNGIYFYRAELEGKLVSGKIIINN
jgi:hypothetical protein